MAFREPLRSGFEYSIYSILTCTIVVSIEHGKDRADTKDIIILMEIHL